MRRDQSIKKLRSEAHDETEKHELPIFRAPRPAIEIDILPQAAADGFAKTHEPLPREGVGSPYSMVRNIKAPPFLPEQIPAPSDLTGSPRCLISAL